MTTQTQHTQAGEPEVVVLPEWTANMDDESAIARFIRDNEPAGPDADEFRQQLSDAIHEAIAKKDAEAAELRAALVGCVEAMQESLKKGFDSNWSAQGRVSAAITQAQEQLK